VKELQFLEYERERNRQDLILPLYFVTSAKIEKDERSDPLVNELVKRNIYDWREKANKPVL
jgi:hypothetical protein